MAAETVITQSRKRVRLEQQSTSGPLVSLQAILSLANETQRCVNEGEATFNAGHVVCCGIKSSTDTEVSVESLCLQTSAIKGPPHCVNVTVRQDTGSVKGTCTCKAGLSGKCKHFFATLIYLNRTSKDSLDLLSCTDVQQQWGRTASSCLYEPRPVNTFCHVQRPTQKEFPEDIQKEILKELIDAAPESALAKHKTLSRLGLVVVPEVPWLGYSPDGVIIQGNKRILVEVKCPVLGQEQSIAELFFVSRKDMEAYLSCYGTVRALRHAAHAITLRFLLLLRVHDYRETEPPNCVARGYHRVTASKDGRVAPPASLE
ncbi:hypothetical protein HPB50_020879 [Hyalomma asiaticum]|uniref:Uncharacterized protein n=1 Tax=Hyalomma asiaticum TaxID=266040 RepID=A0ACB7RW89_HYAAI|nr:hypothetical protein HPB50_020879 [Hyalomma asiaticum]